jgi:hypothetical protein
MRGTSVTLKRKYKRFEMKRPNELVQMDTKLTVHIKCSLLNIQSNSKADKALAIDPKDKNALYNNDKL